MRRTTLAQYFGGVLRCVVLSEGARGQCGRGVEVWNVERFDSRYRHPGPLLRVLEGKVSKVEVPSPSGDTVSTIHMAIIYCNIHP
jgi:hypothetical protein